MAEEKTTTPGDESNGTIAVQLKTIGCIAPSSKTTPRTARMTEKIEGLDPFAGQREAGWQQDFCCDGQENEGGNPTVDGR